MKRIGIDLGGTKIEGVALSDDGQVQGRIRHATPKDGYDSVISTLGNVIRELESQAGTKATVGIGTPGSISPHDGRMQNCSNVSLNGHTLREDLASHIGRRFELRTTPIVSLFPRRPTVPEGHNRCSALSSERAQVVDSCPTARLLRAPTQSPESGA